MSPITFLLLLIGWYILSCFGAYLIMRTSNWFQGIDNADIDEHSVFTGGLAVWLITTVIFFFTL